MGGRGGALRDFAGRERRHLHLVVYALVLLLIGIIIVSLLTFGDVKISRVAFPNTYSKGKERVAGLLYTPDHVQPGTKVPAVVFANGFVVYKELYVPMCRELARHGIEVLAIDLPGFGGSGGHSDLGNTEYTAMLAAYDWLVRNHPEVDPARVAAAGHSLGGVTAVRAGILQKEKKFSAVAAIYCYQGPRQLLELIYGPIEQNLARQWPFMCFSRSFNITDARAFKEREVISKLTPTKPPNFLLVVGGSDELCTVKQDNELMARAVGAGPIVQERLYGSFEDGTARMLVMTGDTHLTEAYSSAVFKAVYDWVTSSFGVKQEYAFPSLMFRYSGWGSILLGALLLGIAVALILYRELTDRFARQEAAQAVEEVALSAGSGVRVLALVYFVVIALAALPLAKVLGIKVVVPFFVGDLVVSLAIMHGLLVLLAIGAIVMIKARGTQPLRDIDWRGGARRDLWAALPAAGGYFAFLLLYVPLARFLYLGPGLPYSFFWFILFVAVITSVFWVHGKYFHLFLLPMFGDTPRRWVRLGYVVSEAALRSLTLAVAVIPLMSGPFTVVGRPGSFRMPVVAIILITSLPVYLVIAFLNLKARDKGTSLLTPSLFAALFMGWALMALVSAR